MTLRRSTQIYLESELSNYKYIDKDIARVREEVLNPWQPTDTNIGGEHVHSNISVTEIKATRVVNDRRLSISKNEISYRSSISFQYAGSSKVNGTILLQET